MEIKTAKEIINDAIKAGRKAGQEHNPTPMVVEMHTDQLDDSSPVEQSWNVPDGVCGFAWVIIRCKSSMNRSFINALKKAGLVWTDPYTYGPEAKGTILKRDSYYGGYCYWVSDFNQSMERKEKFAHAFSEVLEKYGIESTPISRLD